MESLDELTKTNGGKTGFFKHVFNFNDESKSEMLNIVQYAVLALIPVIILNKYKIIDVNFDIFLVDSNFDDIMLL